MAFPLNLGMNISLAGFRKDESAGDMVVIIQRPYAHLEKEMRRTFGSTARVIVDRRMGERRGPGKAPSEDRRRGIDAQKKSTFWR